MRHAAFVLGTALALLPACEASAQDRRPPAPPPGEPGEYVQAPPREPTTEEHRARIAAAIAELEKARLPALQQARERLEAASADAAVQTRIEQAERAAHIAARTKELEAALAAEKARGVGDEDPEIRELRTMMEHLAAASADPSAVLRGRATDALRDQRQHLDAQIEDARRRLDYLRALAKLEAEGQPLPRGHAGMGGLGEIPGGGADAHHLDARARFQLEGRPDPGPHGVDARLDRLEHAVRELHELLGRHDVPPEARERALREMHGRRGEGENQHAPSRRVPLPLVDDSGAPREDLGLLDDAGQRNRHPPVGETARLRMPEFKVDHSAHDVVALREHLRRLDEENGAMRAQLEEAHRSLADTREALETVRKELEAVQSRTK